MRQQSTYAHLLVCLAMLLGAGASHVMAQVAQSPRRVAATMVKCPETTSDLYQVQQLYKSGEFGPIADMKACVEQLYDATKPSNDPKTELLAVAEGFFHLYALSCIAENQPENAEFATKWLLQRFPRHQIDPEMDPPQFRLMMDSLVPYGANHLGIYAGMNLSFARNQVPQRVFTDLSTGADTVIGPTMRQLPRYDVGLIWQHHFGIRHSLVLGLGLSSYAVGIHYASRKFDRNATSGAQAPVSGDWMVNQFDKYTFLQIPLHYQFRIPFGGLAGRHRSWLGLDGGVFGRALIHAETELLNRSWEDDGDDGDDALDENISQVVIESPMQRVQRFSAGIGAGVSYQMHHGLASFFVRLGAQWSLTELNLSGAQFDENIESSIWEYHILDQKVRLHGFLLTAGVLLPKSHRVFDIHAK